MDCDKCVHKSVCKHKDEYVQMIGDIKREYVANGNELFRVSIDCREYWDGKVNFQDGVRRVDYDK